MNNLTNKTSKQDYWEQKFSAYLHDPIDKAFGIQGHEERSGDLIEIFGAQKPNYEHWKAADSIAAGFERGRLPGYDKNKKRSGAVDFIKDGTVLTHPVSSEKVGFSVKKENVKRIHEELCEFLKSDVGVKPGEGVFKNFDFSRDHTGYRGYSIARMFYIHFVLRHRLAQENIGGIGALWHRLPADTRIPDHSIWQHNSLTSAIYSCMNLSEEGNPHDNIGIMVFSISPVQQFISKARKLRDYWTGSLLISWLAFEGIKWVMENIGPDHVLYPSLVDQPLMDDFMNKKWSFDTGDYYKKEKSVASFPNKFMVLVPLNHIDEIGNSIKDRINKAWKELTYKSLEFILNRLGAEVDKDTVSELFKRQTDRYWELKWAASKAVSIADAEHVKELYNIQDWDKNKNLYEAFQKIQKDNPQYKESSSIGSFYSVSHSLSQSALSALKAKKIDKRAKEPGEKCSLCGEFEVLHDLKFKNDISAKDYNVNIKCFWNKIKTNIGNAKDSGHDKPVSSEINDNERLCSICTTKRFLSFLNTIGDHPLSYIFKDHDNFPSTAELALNEFFKRNNITNANRKEIAEKVFNDEEVNEGKVYEFDRYYAILMMDGDKMGDLINGKTLDSTWESVIHPDIVNKIKTNNFSVEMNQNWNNIFEEGHKRHVTPSIHGSISEALGDFSIYNVPYIIKKYNGKLIYAGGDDVCAVLPVKDALNAANEIKKHYNKGFSIIQNEKKIKSIQGEDNSVENGKLSIQLGGNGADTGISISAGILICHLKENLSHMINSAHELLESYAKKKGGRNSCALELKKRSGGSRYFVGKWDSKKWDSFDRLTNRMKTKEDNNVSNSFAYKLSYFSDGIMSILNNGKMSQSYKKDKLIKFIKYQLEHSNERTKDMAEDILNIIIEENEINRFNDNSKNDDLFNTEGLILASFMGNYNIAAKEMESGGNHE